MGRAYEGLRYHYDSIARYGIAAEESVLTNARKVFFGSRKRAASITPDDALAQINISSHSWPYVVL